jgi:NAD(P)-dependent dehydrogenase (short-subunit alcohol dehydrogenase family)
VSPRAIVTGASSGIGRATAVALADKGFDIGITWRENEAGALETARAVRNRDRQIEVRQLDLTVPDEAAGVVETLGTHLGGLDVLVNNAGMNRRAYAIEETLDAWRKVLDSNLTGTFACAQAGARVMMRAGTPGRIINVTSVHEHVPLRRGAAYCASKAAVGMLTRVMALELAEYRIAVNSVAPGHVATPMTGYDRVEPLVVERDGIPEGRIGRPQEVAEAIAHLASRQTYTTGTSWVVDGGLLLMAAVPLQSSVEGE